MELRKIQEMGGGTALISLPKDWVRRHKLTKGSLLAIETASDGRLLLHPVNENESDRREIVIQYPPKTPEHIANEITGSYLLGYDIIRIQGPERISYESREGVKRAVRQLVGLEIVEEDAYSITAQFLPEPTTLAPERIFRRMHLIALGMHKDALTAFVENDDHLVKVVAERDDEVDRLYFLLVRLIRSAVIDLRLAARFNLSPIDCLDYRVAANVLEAVGDAAVDIVKAVSAMRPSAVEQEARRNLRAVISHLEVMQDLAVKAFLKRDAEDARRVVNMYQEMRDRLREFEVEAAKKPGQLVGALLAMLAAIEKICRCQVDIADLAVPQYPVVS